MSTSTQVSTEVKSSKPTWQDIEKTIVVIVQAGVFYKKKKDEKFIQIIKSNILNCTKLKILIFIF